MALDHSTFLTHISGGSAVVTVEPPSFDVTTVSGATAGGNVYGPAPHLVEPIHKISFRRNVVVAGWHDDDGTDAASALYLFYNLSVADVSFLTSAWGYRTPTGWGGRWVRIEFREIPSRAPRARVPGSDDTEMTVVTPFDASDFDGTSLCTLLVDWSVAGQVSFLLTSDSGAEYSLTLPTTADASTQVAEPCFVWHLHDYSSGNREIISSLDIVPPPNPFALFECSSSFRLTWSDELSIVTHELRVQGGEPVPLIAGVESHPEGPFRFSGIDVVWNLDASRYDSLTLVSDRVAAAQDVSGSGYDVEQSTASLRPLYLPTGLNGQPALQFSGGDELGNHSVRPADGIMSIFCVLYVTDSNYIVLSNNDSRYLLIGSNGSGSVLTGGIASVGAYWRTGEQVSPANRDQFHDLFDNRTSVMAATNVDFSPWTGGFVIGGYNHSSWFFDGVVAEFLVVAGELTQQQIDQINGYLAWKWGLEGDLPAEHPHKNSFPPHIWPPLSVSGLSAAFGLAGETIYIYGQAFRPTTELRIEGAIEASAQIIDEETISFVVSASLPYGPLSVEVISGAESVSVSFAHADPADVSDWTPEELPSGSVLLWLDADDATTVAESGGAVSQWSDKSASGNHMTQGSGASQPIITAGALNGRSTISFDGSNDWMTSATNFIGSNDSVTAAYVGNAGIGRGLDGSGAGWSLIFHSQTQVVFTGQLTAGYSSGVPDNVDIADDSVRVGTVQQGGEYGMSFDGEFVSKTTSNYRYRSSGIRVVLGRTGSTSSYRAGYFGEIIILNFAADESLRQKLEGYLAHRWGLASKLPAAHPYKTAPPTIYAPTFDESALWTPSSLGATVKSWFDAADPASYTLGAGGVVDALVDKANGLTWEHHGTNKGTILPEAVNGRDVFRNNSSRCMYKIADPRPVAAHHIGVWQWRTGNSSYEHGLIHLGHGDVGTATGSRVFSSSYGMQNAQTAALRLNGADAGVGLNLMKSSVPEIWSLELTPTYANVSNSGLLGYDHSSLGSRSPSVDYMEIISTDTLTAEEMQKIEGYLAYKWGIQLDAAHPYASTPPLL